MKELQRRLNEMFGPLFADMEQQRRKQERQRAQADPLAHKQSRVFENSSYRYWDGGRDGRGSRVLFCWSSHRNVAGFFLGWRETHYRNGRVKRDQWVSRRVKKRCREIAARRRDAFKAKHQPSPPPVQVGLLGNNQPIFKPE